MSKFEDRIGNPPGRNLLSSIGFSIAAVFLAALGIAIIVVVIVPAVLAVGFAAAIIRRLKFRKIDRSDKALVIEGEYEVLHSGTGDS